MNGQLLNEGTVERFALANHHCSRRMFLAGALTGTALFAWGRPVVAAAAEARIRFLNAILPATALDIYLDGEMIDSALPFGEVSKIRPTPTGAFEIAAVPAGAPVVAAMAKRQMELDPGLTYEVAIFGQVTEGYLQAGELADTYIQEFGVVLLPLADDAASLRMVHLAPDLPAVDLRLSTDSQFFEDVIYPGATPYITTPAGIADLTITTTLDQVPVLSLPATKLTARKVHHLFLIGQESDDTLQAVMHTWWAERGTAAEATSGAPTEEEIAYLTELQSVRDIVMQSLLNLDEILTDGTFSAPYMNMFAWVCIGLATGERSLLELTPPERYTELHQTMINAITPVADAAREISTVEEWMNDTADAVTFTTSDFSGFLQAVVNALPALQQANAMLTAALEEAGIPPSS